MVHPIWKNYFVNLGNAESQEYAISYNQEGSLISIYHGKAWRKPGESSIKICINDICADWLVNTFPSLSERFSRNDMPVEFVVQTISTAGVYSEVARVRFINDWSYDPEYNHEEKGLALPINGRIDARQWLLWTGLGVSEVQAEIILSNGESIKVFIPVEMTADFNADFNADFAVATRAAGSGTAVFSPAQWGDVPRIIINGNQYDIINSCSRYVLYYLNAHGGWDSLLIEGAASEEDRLTRHTMTKMGIYDREKSNYLNEIEKGITLHTSWLSDEQSLRMHHLLNSTDVYLHDLDNNRILPVILEGSSTPYKTFKGEGGKLVNYTINVTIAQSRMRR
jgi:hypothetical protein